MLGAKGEMKDKDAKKKEREKKLQIIVEL